MFIIPFICIILVLFGGFKVNEFFNGNKSKLEEAERTLGHSDAPKFVED